MNEGSIYTPDNMLVEGGGGCWREDKETYSASESWDIPWKQENNFTSWASVRMRENRERERVRENEILYIGWARCSDTKSFYKKEA